ncbi:MAG: DUF58 domain-containing protein, partial [Nitrospiraceae bacterium]|nr:DUF58 domain-containing protein [Nitrospiraceae bacterium]
MTQTKEIIKQVKKIEIKTRHLVDTLISGSYHSIFKGQGIEFSEIREYHPGDDIRAIDWKVTARYNKPFIKEFVEERNLRIYFLFDYSASGDFGNMFEKKRKAIELTATLLFSAIRNNDNAGLFIFTDHIERYIPPRKGKRHALKLITALVEHMPQSKKTDLNSVLIQISHIIKKRSIIFIISDFYSDNFVKPLSILKNKHDVIAIRIWDNREQEIPNIGLIELEDEETGEQILIDTSDEDFRKNYIELMRNESKKLNNIFKKYKIDSMTVTTNEPYEIPLRKF